MTVLAFGRSCGEVDVDQLRFQVRRLVAVDASRGSMRANQWE